MQKNILKLHKKYHNVVDLHDAHPVLGHENEVVDLRERPPSFDRRAFNETLKRRVSSVRSVTRKAPVKVNYFSSVYKTIAILLIVSLSGFSLSQIGSTFSIFNDVETSAGNEYVAGYILDFSLALSPFSNDAWTNLVPGTTTAQDVDVEPNILSNPFMYFASSTNYVGDEVFCDSINVLAMLSGDVMYDGSLTSLLTGTTTDISSWNLEFSNDTNFFNSVCQFDIDFNGWQTRHDYPNYHDGFSDTEKTTHTLYSDGLKINKVYFEKEGGGCLCGDINHEDYGDDGEFHCDGEGGSITIVNTNDGSVVNGGESESETGGNDASGGHGDKVTLCHATESETNPWNRIVVSPNAINGHFLNNGTPKAGHEDDVVLEGDVLCPFQKEWVYGEGTFEDLYTHFDIPADIETGEASSSVEVTNVINQNYTFIGSGSGDYEWVELYNPNSEPASIDGWFLCDGQSCDVLNDGEPIPPFGFAVIAGTADVWKDWNIPDDFVRIVVDDGAIGDGLDNDDDALFLKRPDYFTFDQVNWGVPDILWPYYVPELWNPGVGSTTPGSMIARIPTGFDTNQVTDWQSLERPTVNLIYPRKFMNHPWYWNYDYLITWDSFNPNGPLEDLLVDLILIQDTNYNRRVDNSDERVLLKNKIFNDGIESITVPEGFIGYVWLQIVVTGPENPMANGSDRSGKIYDPIPDYMLDNEEDQKVMEEAVVEQIEATGESEFKHLLIEPIDTSIESTATSTKEVPTPQTASSTPQTATTTATTTIEAIEENASTTPEIELPQASTTPATEEVATSTEPTTFKEEVLELIEEASGAEPEESTEEATTTPVTSEEEEIIPNE